MRVQTGSRTSFSRPRDAAVQSQSEFPARVKTGMHDSDHPSVRAPKVAPARACAYAVIRRVFEDGAWADRALQGEAKRRRLDPRDVALATQLSFGTVQRVATLDHVLHASGPASGGGAGRTRARGAAPRDLPARVPRPGPGPCRRRRVGRAGQGRRAPRRRPRQRRPAAGGTRGEDDDRAPPGGHAGTGRAQALAPGVDRAVVVGHVRRRDGVRPDGRRQPARRGLDPGQHAAHERRGAGAAASGARGRGARPRR